MAVVLTVAPSALSPGEGRRAPGVDAQGHSLVRPDTIIAQVFGKSVGISEMSNLPGIIIDGLLDTLVQEEHIVVTDQEIDQCTVQCHDMITQRNNALANREKELSRRLSVKGLKNKERETIQEELNAVRSLLKNASFPPPNDSSAVRIEAEISRSMVNVWKINLLLFRRFGGRAVYQQAGIEPLDAYRDFLKDQQQKGRWEIFDQTLSQRFWRYYEDDALHTFVPANETKTQLEHPWWNPGK